MGAECHRCGRDIVDECGHCDVVDQRDALVEATRNLMAVYMADGELDPYMNVLTEAAGLSQQEGS